MYNLEIFTPKNGRPDGTVIAVGGEIATCTAMFPSIELHNRRFTESKDGYGSGVLGVSLFLKFI